MSIYGQTIGMRWVSNLFAAVYRGSQKLLFWECQTNKKKFLNKVRQTATLIKTPGNFDIFSTTCLGVPPKTFKVMKTVNKDTHYKSPVHHLNIQQQKQLITILP